MGLILGSGSSKPQYPYDMWYGVKRNLSSSDYKLERVGNLDLHRTLPIQKRLRRFVENPDGSVKYYLGANDSRKKDSGATADITGADGNVMVEKPDYYVRIELKGSEFIYAISEYPLPGFVQSSRKAISAFYGTYDNVAKIPVSGSFLTWNGDDVARDSKGFPVFTANAVNCRGGSNNSALDGTYQSQLGMARTGISKATVRSWCNAAGNGIHHGAYRCYNEIAWLQRIEYASLHCQDTFTTTLSDGYAQGGLGSGCSVDGGQWNTHNGYNPFIPSGVTATLGNNTGKVNYTVKNWANSGTDKVIPVTSYRGLETPFEYLWMLADDILVRHGYPTADKSTFYLCEDKTKFTSHSDSATTVPDGYKAMTEIALGTSNYILNNDVSEKGISFPSQLGGAANKGYCDHYWQPGAGSTGWYGALLAAPAFNGSYAGFGYLHAYYRSSGASAHIGFRLCRN